MTTGMDITPTYLDRTARTGCVGWARGPARHGARREQGAGRTNHPRAPASSTYGAALSTAAPSLAPWELIGFPLSVWSFGPSPITDGTVTSRPADPA
jgi:hypothetical protein